MRIESTANFAIKLDFFHRRARFILLDTRVHAYPMCWPQKRGRILLLCIPFLPRVESITVAVREFAWHRTEAETARH